MTLDEYRAALRTLSATLAHAREALAPLPLDEIGKQLEHADSLGPVLDPTAWREANSSGLLEVQRALLKWAWKTLETSRKASEFAVSWATREAAKAERQEIGREDVGELRLEGEEKGEG